MLEEKNKTGIVSSLIWKFAERVCAQLVSLVVSIILARILLPTTYGMISMVTVFISIADVFVISGLGTSLIQKKDADEVDYSSVFYANMVLSLILYGGLFILAPLIADFYGYRILSPVIRVMGLRIIIAAANSVQSAYVSKHMMFRLYFWATLFGTLLSGVVGIVLAYEGAGVWALVAQYLTNSCVDTIVLFFTVKWKPKAIFSWKRVKELVSYGWKILFEALSQTLVSQLRNLIVGKVYTSEELAYYTKGQQFPNLLMTNICSSISSVLFPAMSNINDDHKKVKMLMRQSVRMFSYILFPMLIGMAIIAKPFVILVLTEKWVGAVPYLKLFCIYLLLQVGMHPRHEAMKAIGRSDVYMNEHVLFRAIDILLLIFVLKKGTMAILISSIISEGVLTGILAYTSKKYTGYDYKEQMIDIKNPILLTIIMYVLASLVACIPVHQYLVMIIQILISALVYITLSVLLKVPEFGIALSMVRKILKRG